MTYEEFEPAIRRRGYVPKFHVASRGYLYAILCAFGVCKIGASTNPTSRVRDQITPDGRLNYIAPLSAATCYSRPSVTHVFISQELQNFRQVERALQRSISPFRFGLNSRAETFRLPPLQRERVVELFETNFSNFAELVARSSPSESCNPRSNPPPHEN